MTARLRFKDLVTDSSNNNLASGLLLGMISLSFGILNAACITSISPTEHNKEMLCSSFLPHYASH
ncbi:DUF350 domain-containing protein [Moraxella osloensis]|nr:DUF350 domain-containing protein [Moraxella osloensis]UAY37096.1 DUF350 domain-containing protein [Moraxella osloensis]